MLDWIAQCAPHGAARSGRGSRVAGMYVRNQVPGRFICTYHRVGDVATVTGKLAVAMLDVNWARTRGSAEEGIAIGTSMLSAVVDGRDW